MTTLDLTKQVKLSNPQSGEESVIYNVVNYNEVTKRVYIESVNTSVKSQEIVSVNDIENV
jgi:hypothetical protein